MTNKDKIELAIKLIGEVIDDTQTDEFKNKGENNRRISGVVRTFGSQFKAQLKPLSTWISDSE